LISRALRRTITLMKSRALLVVGLLAFNCGWVQAQSLADVARAEEARRQDVAKAKKVYTNNDLKPDPSRPLAPPAAPAGAAAPDAAKPAGAAPAASAAAPAEGQGQARDQAYWSGRIGEARSQLDRNRAFATALQNRIDMLWTDFVNRDNPVERSAIERDRNGALAELDRLKKEMEEQAKGIAAIEEEARRAGVPAAWLRPS
jgi:hypothetical protein